jgi:hypothetical protein
MMAAASPNRAKFAHRSNRNGTTDSICRECFATVTTAIWEADLERAERAHCCDPSALQHSKIYAMRDVRPLQMPRRATS